MSIIAGYSSGRVSVAQDTNQVTGVDTAWIAGAIREGDYLWINGLTVKIASVIDNFNLLLAFPWPGDSVTDSVYEIRYTNDSQRVLSSSRDLINKMNQGGLAAIGSLVPVAGGMIHYVNSNNAEIIVSGAKGRSLLQAEDVAEAQASLELIPQSNMIDATINRLLKTGSFGLGAINAPLIDDINRNDIPAGFYRVDKTITLGTKPPLSDVADSLIVLHPTPSQTTQIYLGMTENGRNYIRKGNSTSSWSPWRSIVLDFESGTGPGSNLDADMVDGYHASDFVLKTEMGQGSILDLIKDADGAGSGLDADLLDGHHAAAFGRLSVASSWTARQNFNAGIRTGASSHEQAQFGYGRTSIYPTLSFYSNTTRTGFIQDEASAGLIVASGAGGQLLISGSGVVNINGKQLATREYTDAQISALVDAAPPELNTLNKLAAALGNDPNFATTIINQIASNSGTGADTAADILAKIKTVDGSGSGLDADTLDGISSSSFIRNNLNTPQALINTLTVTNYSNVKAASATSTDAGYIIYNETTLEQSRLYWNRGNNTTYLRNRSNDGTSWYNIAIGGDGVLTFTGNKVYHSGNHGSNSGLDADLLDGQHGSYYLDPANLSSRIGYDKLPTDVVRSSGDTNFDGSVITNNGNIIANKGVASIRRLAADNAIIFFDTIDANNNFVLNRSYINAAGDGRLIIYNSVPENQGLPSGIQLRVDGSIVFNAPGGLIGNGSGLIGVNANTAATAITAGSGLTGGGDLTANRSIAMGTPSAITATSTNSVTATSHTHELPATEVAKLIASLPVGSIGSYAFLRYTGSSDILVGEAVSGSSLSYTSGSGVGNGGSPSGTWRAIGRIYLSSNDDRSTLFLRIS